MNTARAAYNALFPIGAAGAHALAWPLPKLRAALAGRRGYRARWEALGRSLAAPPVWFHVASVGEFEQARPLISMLERDRPDIPVVLTFSSPSGYRFARRREAGGAIRFIDYLPLDTAHAMRFCLRHARPRALIIVKFDVWPNLVWEANEMRVPILLVDATLSPSSRRRRGAGRWLYRDVYRRIDRILAISEDDARRFAEAAPGHPHIAVTGDTRFDRVMERWVERRSGLDLEDDGSPTLIAGSTWPPDEARLLPAVARLLAEQPSLRFVAVPHEPTPAHVVRLRQWATDNGLSVRTVGSGSHERTRVVIIDVVGILAEAYRVAHVAYVGGAFTTGVHSVIEPAIAGIPVVFGPRHDNSFEALQLVARGAATAVANVDETYAALRRYLTDAAARESAGAAARSYVEGQLGATQKCMAALRPYL